MTQGLWILRDFFARQKLLQIWRQQIFKWAILSEMFDFLPGTRSDRKMAPLCRSWNCNFAISSKSVRSIFHPGVVFFFSCAMCRSLTADDPRPLDSSRFFYKTKIALIFHPGVFFFFSCTMCRSLTADGPRSWDPS